MGTGIGERIKLERERLGWTQGQLAGKLDLTIGTVSGYERNYRTPDLDTVNKIAAILGCSVDYLLGRTNTRQTHKKQLDLLDALEDEDFQLTLGSSPLSQDQRLSILNSLDKPILPKLRLPILGAIKADIPLLSEENIVGHIDIPADLEGKVDFALYVRGDSMIGAGIQDNDVVVCKQQETAVNGQIVAALVNEGKTTLKYFIQDNGKILLRAANPAYRDIVLEHGDQVQGYVVKILKDPPPINTYREFIYLKEGHLQEWNESIEKALACGIKPSAFKEFIDMQIELVRRFSGKRSI